MNRKGPKIEMWDNPTIRGLDKSIRDVEKWSEMLGRSPVFFFFFCLSILFSFVLPSYV